MKLIRESPIRPHLIQNLQGRQSQHESSKAKPISASEERDQEEALRELRYCYETALPRSNQHFSKIRFAKLQAKL